MQQDRSTLVGIQVGRGGAALSVLTFHSEIVATKYFSGTLSGGAAAIGQAGVDFFFVLSGFVIWWAHAADIDKPHRLSRYVWKRATRIYPPYWVALTLMIVGLQLTARGLPDTQNGAIAMMLDAALVPHAEWPLLPVAWTLSYELAFYGVFALLIADKRIGFIAVSLSCLLCPYAAHFMLGAATAWCVRRRYPAHPTAWLALSLLLFLVIALETGASRTWAIGFCYAVASALAIGWLATVRRSPRALRLAGDASYSIYLVHYPAMVLAAKVIGIAGVWAHGAIVLVGVAAGIIFHLLVERPLLGALALPSTLARC